MTPYRGIRVLTRAGQVLQNSDTELEQLMCTILGDEIYKGFALIARDDGMVGGNTKEETIQNWNIVLSKMAANNLKIEPRNLKILPEDTEFYGFRLNNGTIRPSDHI